MQVNISYHPRHLLIAVFLPWPYGKEDEESSHKFHHLHFRLSQLEAVLHESGEKTVVTQFFEVWPCAMIAKFLHRLDYISRDIFLSHTFWRR